MKRLLFGTIALCALAEITEGATLVAWDVNGVAGSSTALAATTVLTDSGTTIFDAGSNNTLTRTTVTLNTTANAFNSTNWNATNTFNQNTNYVSFTLSTAVGYAATITDISWAGLGSGTGPATWEMGYSINGGAFVLAPTQTMTTTLTAKVWDMSDFAVAATDTVEFRFWAYGTGSISGGTSSTAGTVRLGNAAGNDLIVNGSFAAVPEPTTTAMLIGGVGAMFWIIRRKRATQA